MCADHSHEHRHEGEENGYFRLARIGVSSALFALGFAEVVPDGGVFWIYIAAYLIVATDIICHAFARLFKGEWFDENFLMAIASIGAFFLGEYPEGIAVVLFYQVGEYFQNKAIARSRKSIADMMDLRPDETRVKIGEEEEMLHSRDVRVGDIIIVKAGERIPLDGTILEGQGNLNTSALTGESTPRQVRTGDSVLAGTINLDGFFYIRTDKDYGDSTLARILKMVEETSEKKAPTEKFITKFSFYYTPLVVLLAVLLAIAPPLAGMGEWQLWIHRALVLLVISCPCALVLSVPLAFFAGIGNASKNSILIKGGNYLEALSKVDTVVFDKTGTLTKGKFEVLNFTVSDGTTKDDMMYYAAHAEHGSLHIIAETIGKFYDDVVDPGRISSYKEFHGKGVEAVVGDKVVLVGNAELMKMKNIQYAEASQEGTIVYVAVDERFFGFYVLGDELRKDSSFTVDVLRNLGVRRIVMLTGDLFAVAMRIKKTLNLDEARAELLPDQKVEEIERLVSSKTTSGSIVFVGDGINDAPGLIRADVGVAMGNLGSDAAIEAADVVLMTDELSKLPTAMKIALKTKKIATQNIILALSVKLAMILLGSVGLATMWEAVFADVGVSVIAVLNAIRAMKL